MEFRSEIEDLKEEIKNLETQYRDCLIRYISEVIESERSEIQHHDYPECVYVITSPDYPDRTVRFEYQTALNISLGDFNLENDYYTERNLLKLYSLLQNGMFSGEKKERWLKNFEEERLDA